jgi:hypothetical protein
MLCFIYTITLYVYYLITLYHVYLIVSREDWSARLGVRPRTLKSGFIIFALYSPAVLPFLMDLPEIKDSFSMVPKQCSTMKPISI